MILEPNKLLANKLGPNIVANKRVQTYANYG